MRGRLWSRPDTNSEDRCISNHWEWSVGAVFRCPSDPWCPRQRVAGLASASEDASLPTSFRRSTPSAYRSPRITARSASTPTAMSGTGSPGPAGTPACLPPATGPCDLSIPPSHRTAGIPDHRPPDRLTPRTPDRRTTRLPDRHDQPDGRKPTFDQPGERRDDGDQSNDDRSALRQRNLRRPPGAGQPASSAGVACPRNLASGQSFRAIPSALVVVALLPAVCCAVKSPGGSWISRTTVNGPAVSVSDGATEYLDAVRRGDRPAAFAQPRRPMRKPGSPVRPPGSSGTTASAATARVHLSLVCGARPLRQVLLWMTGDCRPVVVPPTRCGWQSAPVTSWTVVEAGVGGAVPARDTANKALTICSPPPS